MRSPIHGLPVELLSEIFTIVACLARQTVTPTAWMQLLLVCKRWKTVACDVAELWRVIYVNSNQSWLCLCLARAPRCLIDLHLANVSAADLHAAKHLILPLSDRIRAIRIHDSLKGLTDGVADLFTVGLPSLEELSFSPVEWRVKRETSLALSAQAFPRLRSLTLSGVSIPVEPAFYKNMRHLELHEHCCRGNRFTIGDLFDVLAAASLTLEDLDLSRFDPVLGKTLSLERPQIHLRNLQSFYMDNSFTLASHLLKHLRIPPTVHIRLRLDLAPDTATAYLTTGHLLAAAVPPNIRATMDHGDQLVVHIEHKRFSIQVFDATVPARSPSNSDLLDGIHPERVRVELLGSYISGEALGAVPTICASPRLTTLSIDSPYVVHDVQAWKTVLGAFPLLEHLTIEGDQGSSNDTVGVAFTALAREADAERSGSASKSSARCPSLKTVHVEGRCFLARLAEDESLQFLRHVWGCLQSRDGHAHKLERLSMRSFLPEEFAGRDELYAAFKRLCLEVEW